MSSESENSQMSYEGAIPGMYPMGYETQKFSSARARKNHANLKPSGSRSEPPPHLRAVIDHLSNTFQAEPQYRQFMNLRGPNAQKLLDIFQAILDSPYTLDSIFRRNLVVAMQRLAKAAFLYPGSYELDYVRLEGTTPVAAGSFGDVYKGRYRGQLVCLKMIRLYQTSLADEFLKKFTREGILWAQLSHPNVVPFYGFSRHFQRPCFVSPWMNNGDINEYLRSNPTSNRYLLISDIAKGLEYLHFYGIIHGDLKGANILVDHIGRAQLADFGISSVSDTSILHWTTNSTVASRGGSIRWQAPELFDLDGDEEIYNTAASDVYAWSCVCYEIFTGKIPFYEVLRDHTVMYKVKQDGLQPTRPLDDSPVWTELGLTVDFWSLMVNSWNARPDIRPVNKKTFSPARYRSAAKRNLLSTFNVVDLRQLLDHEESSSNNPSAGGS